MSKPFHCLIFCYSVEKGIDISFFSHIIVLIPTSELSAEFKANVSYTGKENSPKLIDSTVPTQDSERIHNWSHDTPRWWTVITFKTCLHIKLLDRTKEAFWLQKQSG